MLSLRFTSKHLLITEDGVTTPYPLSPSMQRRVKKLKIKSYQSETPLTVASKRIVKSERGNVKSFENVYSAKK